MVTIKIITGSTRPGRFNEQVAQWAYDLAKQYAGDAKIELVDIAKLDLPLWDEAESPMYSRYTKEHTKRWSRIIDEADGYLVIAPEYNHSVPAALKNAFDYLHHEWGYKPVSFVSYGASAGGARSVEHLRGIAGEVKMYDLREQLLLVNYWNNLSETGQYQFTDEQESQLKTMLSDLIFWAEHMKPARAELKQRAK